MTTTATALARERANQRNAVLAGFLGWTLDAFDFFILVMVLGSVAQDLHVSVPAMAFALTASLATRPLGAFIFGIISDRYGRRLPMVGVIIFYSVVEVASGLAPNYATFLALRFLFGIGMGGEWGVGASLVMETVPVKWRGVLSGLLQEGYALGYLLAAVAYFTVAPYYSWRVLFFIGGLPALLSLWVVFKVEEPEAWHEHKSGDWKTYGREIRKHWKLFLYLVALMAMMNMISHGTQDMYPTFLQQQRHFSKEATATITIISMVGAILGGLTFGLFSDRGGRRKAMVTAVIGAIVLAPLWVFAPSTPLIVVGAFLMQFMVQGAWGVIPAHINELSPGSLRGFFPGFAYQLGVLIASSITFIEAVLGQHLTYSVAMWMLATLVLVVGAFVIGFGPEARGVSFRKAQTH
ncbi:MAG: MFS transporter [Acidobacteriota bacterium]|nr:MFS transporter [Acidobacteriota bacterium]